jgi:deoxyribose-phosphate aldolase
MVTSANNRDINIADYIEHSILHPTTTATQVKEGCNLAIRHNFPLVCVYPSAVKQATELLYNHKILVATVISFPSGASTSLTKLTEAQEAVENGAQELDVMINLGWLKERKSEAIYKEIATIVEATGVPIKAILETTLLTPEEKQLAAEICLDAGVSFLKTSTGWFGGATVEDVQLLSQVTKGRVGIKASGGIRHLSQAIALINAGATRLGTSKGIQLVQEQKNDRFE